MNDSPGHKEFRRLRNAATAILVGLDDLEKKYQALPAPEAEQKKGRSRNKFQEHFASVPAGSWRKPEHLKKTRKKN